MLKNLSSFAVFGLFLLTQNYTCNSDTKVAVSQSVSRELLMTETEKNAFLQFKHAVYQDIPKEFVLARTDLYLLRFIRSKNLDVQTSTREFLAFMNFVKDNNLLKILKDPMWRQWEEEFPVYYDAVDKQKRVVVYFRMGDGWNVRSALFRESGSRKIQLYLCKIVFELNDRLVATGKKYPNVTQTIVLLDMLDANLVELACPSCLLQYVQFLQIFQRWIPGYYKEIIIYNASQLVYVALQTIRPFLSDVTVFNSNRNAWRPYLEERIDSRQLDLIEKWNVD